VRLHLRLRLRLRLHLHLCLHLVPHRGHCWPINAPFHKIECRSILRFMPSSQSMSQEMRRYRGHHRIL
jgi:hypothetical protein